MITTRVKKLTSQRLALLIPLIVALCIAILYVSIAPTRLTNANYGSDGGDLLAAVLTRGIPHPTGYPTYILLGNLFQLIPVSTPVFRGVMESLLPAALGAGLLAGWVLFIVGSGSTIASICAILVGVTWGVSPLLFSQSVIVEVHGLQSLLVVLFLWWIALNLSIKPTSGKAWLLGLSFIIGLGFGNHLTILLFVPAALLVVAYVIRQPGLLRFALAEILLAFLGMLVYIFLPIRAYAYPAINWGNPQTWAGFLWEVSATPYHDFLILTHASTFLERIRSLPGLLLDQVGALGLLAGVIGFVQYSPRQKWLRWILLWIFLAYLTFPIVYNSNDSMSYLLPAVLVFIIWMGFALQSLWKLKWRSLPIGAMLVALLMLSILIRVPGTRLRLDPRSQDQPARYAEKFLRDAPEGAIVYTTTDQDSFPLWYYHFGLHERSDLSIIVLPLTQFVWYQQTLVHIYPHINFPPIYTQDFPNADWGKQIAELNTQLNICNTHISDESETGVAYQCSNP